MVFNLLGKSGGALYQQKLELMVFRTVHIHGCNFSRLFFINPYPSGQGS